MTANEKRRWTLATPTMNTAYIHTPKGGISIACDGIPEKQEWLDICEMLRAAPDDRSGRRDPGQGRVLKTVFPKPYKIFPARPFSTNPINSRACLLQPLRPVPGIDFMEVAPGVRFVAMAAYRLAGLGSSQHSDLRRPFMGSYAVLCSELRGSRIVSRIPELARLKPVLARRNQRPITVVK